MNRDLQDQMCPAHGIAVPSSPVARAVTTRIADPSVLDGAACRCPRLPGECRDRALH
ncbi:hypothetical protein [Aquimonas sp.]|jgi:hypothetical protein|uniref:hypothetical protein n=1 Tax=Aquimonas sp. TaxID=1872588 RepID=UPI0037BF9F5E